MFREFLWEKVAGFDVLGDWHCRAIRTAEDQKDADEWAIAEFWTVYGRKPSGEVRELIDTHDEDDAVKLTDYFNAMLAACRALGGLYEHCTMSHKYWGDNCNIKQANAAIEAGKAALEKMGMI